MGRNFNILDLKSTQLKWKALTGPNSRLKMSEERIGEPEDRSVKFSNPKNREKWLNKNDQSIIELLDKNKYVNMCVMGVPGRE